MFFFVVEHCPLFTWVQILNPSHPDCVISARVASHLGGLDFICALHMGTTLQDTRTRHINSPAHSGCLVLPTWARPGSLHSAQPGVPYALAPPGPPLALASAGIASPPGDGPGRVEMVAPWERGPFWGLIPAAPLCLLPAGQRI